MPLDWFRVASLAPTEAEIRGGASVTGDTWNITLNLISSAIAASVVWGVGRVVAVRRLNRAREFFGLRDRSECLIIIPRHASTSPTSTNRLDVAALLELSPILGYCKAKPEVVFHDQESHGRQLTEFCVGGPRANERTEAHLRLALRGLRMSKEDVEGRTDRWRLTLHVGDKSYVSVRGEREYAALAKIVREDGTVVFVICGQHAATNRATTRYLAENYRRLLNSYGPRGQFCLVLEAAETAVLGPNLIRVLDDATEAAFAAFPESPDERTETRPLP
ncbi:hypothetical protein ABTX24_00890 [Nocardioides sp. NPDC127514]|uniref:hypothetical protein n=1 Tax=unclassified Nocardioides TaxID=2615069 RepID=UPI00332B48EE